MIFTFLKKKIVNVGMRTEEAFYDNFMSLYNKNILEYAQIVQSGLKFLFPNIEVHSNELQFL